MFNPELQTCGTARETFFSPSARQVLPLGCWCYMPIKAALRCNCWLYDVSAGQAGWPPELNDYPHEF